MKIRLLVILSFFFSVCNSQIVNRFNDSTWFKRSVQMDSFLRLTKGAQYGYFLMSDSLGRGIWQPVGAVGFNADNGLNKSGDTVKFGGILHENTFINLDDHIFSIGKEQTSDAISINRILGGGFHSQKITISDSLIGLPISNMFFGFGKVDSIYLGNLIAIKNYQSGTIDIGYKNQLTQESRHIKLGNEDSSTYANGKFLILEAYDPDESLRGKYDFQTKGIQTRFENIGESSIFINLADSISPNRCLKLNSTADTAYWGEVSSGSTDTTSLSNRINLKLNSSDTASLSNRIDAKLNKYDTASLSARIDLKLNKVDTVSLSSRIDLKLNKTDTISLSTRIDAKLNKSDTASLSTRINTKLTTTDTASLNSRINTKLNQSDTASLSARINLKLNSTDTASLSSRINLKLNASDTASLSSRINAKLNLTDTASLSSRINTKLSASDTASLSSRINLKLNQTDTASLSSRINLKLNLTDTASLSTRINTKLNASDTASLSNRINTKMSDDADILIMQALGSTIKAETCPIYNATTSFTMLTGYVFFDAVYLYNAQTITGVKWLQSTRGNYTANNNNKIGLYSYSGGTLTLVASCANDGNLWQTSNSGTVGTKAFSSTYNAAAGLYFIASLYSRSAATTAPVIINSPTSNTGYLGLSGELTNSAKRNAYITGQTDLPSSIAMSSLTANSAVFWFSIY